MFKTLSLVRVVFVLLILAMLGAWTNYEWHQPGRPIVGPLVMAAVVVFFAWYFELLKANNGSDL